MTNTLFGLIQSLIVAIFGLLQTFDIWTMTDDQRGAVLLVYGACTAIFLYGNNMWGKTGKIKDAARAQGADVPSI